ncbi:MAG: ABC transporter permease subunit [Cyclobacteriaceae bacterium]
MEYFSNNILRLSKDFSVTFMESILGLMIAFLVAQILFFLGYISKSFYDFIYPIIVSLQVIPLVTLAPFFIILLGVNMESKIAMAALISFFPIYVNMINGFQNLPSALKNLLHILNASDLQSLRLLMPVIYPAMFSGLKIAATLAIIGSIVSEFTGAKEGLGKNLYVSALQLEPELLVCSLILSAVAGHLLFFLIRLIEMKLGYWYLDEKKNSVR